MSDRGADCSVRLERPNQLLCTVYLLRIFNIQFSSINTTEMQHSIPTYSLITDKNKLSKNWSNDLFVLICCSLVSLIMGFCSLLISSQLAETSSVSCAEVFEIDHISISQT